MLPNVRWLSAGRKVLRGHSIPNYHDFMIINAVKNISTKDVGAYSWARISKFLNVEFTASVIKELHGLGEKHSKNAKNQAEQIRFCLLQAREYFKAADAVSLATKPVLLYYGVMSMAIAEILLKQTADSRLEKLRQNHGCHGLALVVPGVPRLESSLNEAGSNLVAKAQVDKNGVPKGTFEVWRRSGREFPVSGIHTAYVGNGSTSSPVIQLGAADQPLTSLPHSGISLGACLAELPYLADSLNSHGSRPNFVRTSMYSEHIDGQHLTVLTVHPASVDLIEKYGGLIKCSPELINNMEFQGHGSGYSVVIKNLYDAGGFFSLPMATSITKDEVYFSCSDLMINEFGYLYIALHICGNFARYYPDIWLGHVEKSSPLALVIDELCTHAVERLPLLHLSELSRTHHLVG